MSAHPRIYTHPACLGHDPGGDHPECPARLRAVTAALHAAFPHWDWQEAPRASRMHLRRVHTDALLARVFDAGAGGAAVSADPATRAGPGSAEAALHAAGAGVAAVDAVMGGEARRAFCAVRPPGHHATAGEAMGFCLFNNVAVAAAHACERHALARVAVVDFDVHHGNGTQAIFEHDARVLYVSSHQAPLYPGTGHADETGVGNIVNRPLAAGTGSEAFRTLWARQLLPVLDGFRPQLLLVSAGFDAHRDDPLADLALHAEDFAWLTAGLVAIADRHADGRLVSTLEGGYDLDALAACCVAHVDALR